MAIYFLYLILKSQMLRDEFLKQFITVIIMIFSGIVPLIINWLEQ